MSDQLVSVDEFLSHHKGFVKSGDILVKGNTANSSWDPVKRTIRFTMSAEVEDRDRDIVYQDGLKTEQFLKNPQAYFNHRSYNYPVGSWSDIAKVNGRPKRTEGTLTLVTEDVEPEAERLAKHLNAGTIRACSIGFRPKTIRKREVPEDRKDSPYFWPGYDILEAELLECSPCTIPSNPEALAKSAAEGDVIAKELLEEVLDNWAKDPITGILMRRSDFEKAHQRTAGTAGKTFVVVNVPADADDAAINDAVSKALKEANAPQSKETVVPPAPEAKTVTEPTTDDAATADEEAVIKALTDKAPSKGFLRKLLDIVVGPENHAKIEGALQKAAADEEALAAAEAVEREALEARKAALAKRAQGVDSFVEKRLH